MTRRYTIYFPPSLFTTVIFTLLLTNLIALTILYSPILLPSPIFFSSLHLSFPLLFSSLLFIYSFPLFFSLYLSSPHLTSPLLPSIHLSFPLLSSSPSLSSPFFSSFPLIFFSPPLPSHSSLLPVDRKILSEKIVCPSYLTATAHSLLRGMLEKDL